jgi:spermidine synthase
LSSVKILEEFSTPYQDVTVYEKFFENGETDFCLNLDSHTQLCDSTLEFYHAGLVEVPLLYLKKEKLKVLVLGGGDWIAIRLLLQYPNVAEIDHVDIDKKFVEYMKHQPHYQAMHRDAFKDPKVHTVIDDAFSFLRFNTKKYDLILLDLPGLKHDKLSHLYSVEFYLFMRRALREGGVVSLWSYGATPERRMHYKVLMNTFREAGFKHHLPYDAYLLKEGKILPAQPFYLLSDGEDFKAKLSAEASDYMKKTFDRYQRLLWEGIPFFADVRPNTVLRPNYDIVIKT